MRFWLISTKVERKIASTDASIARMTKLRSKRGTPGNKPRLASIHTLYRTRWISTNAIDPVNLVMRSAIRLLSGAAASSASARARRRAMFATRVALMPFVTSPSLGAGSLMIMMPIARRPIGCAKHRG